MKSFFILLISITLSMATPEHNYHVIFSEERVDSDGETYKSFSEQMILIPNQVSNNDKVNFIYNLFDNFPKNNYLTYKELFYIFKVLTISFISERISSGYSKSFNTFVAPLKLLMPFSNL